MSTPTAGELVGLLAEPTRLKTVAALALGARTTDEIEAATGMSARGVATAVSRLTAGGLVEASPSGLWLRAEAFGLAARVAAEASRVVEDHGVSEPEAAAVLRTFLREGRLSAIPAARSKRLVVLDHLSRLFEIGVQYSEKEVSAALRAFHPDYAALRRYLVDEGFLTREAGRYWRTGGSVEV